MYVHLEDDLAPGPVQILTRLVIGGPDGCFAVDPLVSRTEVAWGAGGGAKPVRAGHVATWRYVRQWSPASSSRGIKEK